MTMVDERLETGSAGRMEASSLASLMEKQIEACHKIAVHLGDIVEVFRIMVGYVMRDKVRDAGDEE